MTQTKRLQFRLATALLLVVAAACVAVAIVYLTKTAGNLPGFFPGHTAGSVHHHTKHGIAIIGLAVLALIGAWFSTAPRTPTVD